MTTNRMQSYRMNRDAGAPDPDLDAVEGLKPRAIVEVKETLHMQGENLKSGPAKAEDEVNEPTTIRVD